MLLAALVVSVEASDLQDPSNRIYSLDCARDINLDEIEFEDAYDKMRLETLLASEKAYCQEQKDRKFLVPSAAAFVGFRDWAQRSKVTEADEGQLPWLWFWEDNTFQLEWESFYQIAFIGEDKKAQKSGPDYLEKRYVVVYTSSDADGNADLSAATVNVQCDLDWEESLESTCWISGISVFSGH